MTLHSNLSFLPPPSHLQDLWSEVRGLGRVWSAEVTTPDICCMAGGPSTLTTRSTPFFLLLRDAINISSEQLMTLVFRLGHQGL